MQEAAGKMEFERAAELRDMLENLRKTTAPMRRFTRARLPTTVQPEADMRALQDALRLPRLPRVMECFDISNISTTHIVASMVCFRDGVPDRSDYRRYRIHGVEGQNDFASMAEVIRRRYSRVLLEARDKARNQHQSGTPAAEENETGADAEAGGDDGERIIDLSPDLSQEAPTEAIERLARLSPPAPAVGGSQGQPFVPVRLPDLVIVDGGKGQLSAACKELQRLGLHDLPIIGLAKEFEEIYRPATPLPVRLPEDSGALRLLQRIRDEAHRVANSYHQLLMKKRIAESVLDDCPGVSQHRKQLLLRRFGSVERIRKASAGEIAATEGIGPRLAEQIVEFLQKHA